MVHMRSTSSLITTLLSNLRMCLQIRDILVVYTPNRIEIVLAKSGKFNVELYLRPRSLVLRVVLSNLRLSMQSCLLLRRCWQFRELWTELQKENRLWVRGLWLGRQWTAEFLLILRACRKWPTLGVLCPCWWIGGGRSCGCFRGIGCGAFEDTLFDRRVQHYVIENAATDLAESA